MLNWALMREPVNWLTILLMVSVAAFAADLLCRYYTGANVAGEE